MTKFAPSVTALAIAVTGCAASAPHASTPAASRPAPSASTSASTAGPPDIPNCACPYDAGTYRLDVVPGLQITLPSGWSGMANPAAEVGVHPSSDQDAKLFLFADLSAVQSTGQGHGTPLAGVGSTPRALLKWLLSDHDLAIVSPPVAAILGRGIRTTTLAFGVSPSAGFYERGCKCVDLFTAPYFGDPYGIGGKEEVRMYLGTVVTERQKHTLIVVLDAPDRAALQRLAQTAAPILHSVTMTG